MGLGRWDDDLHHGLGPYRSGRDSGGFSFWNPCYDYLPLLLLLLPLPLPMHLRTAHTAVV